MKKDINFDVYCGCINASLIYLLHEQIKDARVGAKKLAEEYNRPLLEDEFVDGAKSIANKL